MARPYISQLLIAVVLALITFYAFAIGLGVNLPAGVLQGHPVMDNLSLLLDGFANVMSPGNLLVALIRVIAGTAVGVLPGIGPAMTIAE